MVDGNNSPMNIIGVEANTVSNAIKHTLHGVIVAVRRGFKGQPSPFDLVEREVDHMKGFECSMSSFRDCVDACGFPELSKSLVVSTPSSWVASG